MSDISASRRAIGYGGDARYDVEESVRRAPPRIEALMQEKLGMAPGKAGEIARFLHNDSARSYDCPDPDAVPGILVRLEKKLEAIGSGEARQLKSGLHYSRWSGALKSTTADERVRHRGWVLTAFANGAPARELANLRSKLLDPVGGQPDPARKEWLKIIRNGKEADLGYTVQMLRCHDVVDGESAMTRVREDLSSLQERAAAGALDAESRLSQLAEAEAVLSGLAFHEAPEGHGSLISLFKTFRDYIDDED